MIFNVVGDYIESNVFIVTRDDKAIIVDAGANIEKVKGVLDGKKVVGVFLTHGHYDHSLFGKDYIQEFGCKVYASESIKEYLSDADKNYSEGRFVFDDFSNFVFLKGEGVLNIAGFEIFYKQLGGHSKADMIFKLGGDIFVGDLVIGRDMGRIDLYGGNKEQMRESLNYLLALEYDMMHSGHGTSLKKSQQDKVVNLWLKFLNR